MPDIVEQLRRYHRRAQRLLHLLELEVRTQDRTEDTDFDLVSQLISFFQAATSSTHHTEEDLVFGKLGTRDPDRAAFIIDVEAEHGQAARRLAKMSQLVSAERSGRPIDRLELEVAALDFISHERRHIDVEEKELLPAALAVLTAQDWTEIGASLPGAIGPGLEDNEGTLDELSLRLARWIEADRTERRARPERC